MLSAEAFIHFLCPCSRYTHCIFFVIQRYGGYRDEAESLASCYQSSLALAKQIKVKSLAYPGISTGVYGFPKDLAALIAVNETRRFLSKNSFPEKVIFVAYDDESYENYRKLLDQ